MAGQAPRGWSSSKRAPSGDTPKRSARRKAVGTTIPSELKNAERGERLQKVLAEAGVASRRASEELIEAGEVSVNGHVVTELPVWVDRHRDHIVVRGKRLKFPEEFVYVMLFKPRGVVCTNDDPEGRTRAIDLIQHHSNARLFPVGRLDMESSGLLLLTNDGELANKITHPRHGVHKAYEVTVKGQVDDDALGRLESGLFLHDRRRGHGSKTSESRLTIIKRDRDRTRLLMELREGRNRQIRRMMADLGYSVRKLRRVRLGPLKLSGLKAGQWRELTTKELKALQKAADADRGAAKAAKRSKPSKPSS